MLENTFRWRSLVDTYDVTTQSVTAATVVTVILRTSRLCCCTCKVFITDNYMPQNISATEVPECCRVTCLLLAVIGIGPQGIILESAIIVNDYNPIIEA